MKFIKDWDLFELVLAEKGEIISFSMPTQLPRYIAKRVFKGQNTFIFDKPALLIVDSMSSDGKEAYEVLDIREYRNKPIRTNSKYIDDRRLLAAILHWNSAVDKAKEKIHRRRSEDGYGFLICYIDEAFVKESETSVFIIKLNDIDAVKAALPPK